METRNLLTALILSILVLFAWKYFYLPPQPQRSITSSQDTITPAAEDPNTPSLHTNSDYSPIDRKTVLKDRSHRIPINTTNLHGSINLTGARIDDLTLARYKETLKKNSEEVVLLSPSSSMQTYFAEFGWLSKDNQIELPTPETVWQSNQTTLTPAQPVTLSWKNNQNIAFFITIAIDEQYLFTVTQKVENQSNTSITLLPYGLLNRTKHPEKNKSSYILHEGALSVTDGILNETSYKTLQEERKIHFSSNTRGWIGITDKYWLTALIPDQSNFSSTFSHFIKNNANRYQADYLLPAQNIEPHTSLSIKNHLFAGAKKVSLLDNYGKELNIPLFDRAVDFGYLYLITKPIFQVLTYINHLIGNFGLAILALTVLIKLLLFPLANKAFKSMAQLKKLQPQIMEIKERYQDNKVEMNKQIMTLYRQEKINPMAGCLPLLIQIPIFFALYKVLYVTIEMRHAPFYGWIHDLSAPDPTSIFNLFGLIPIELPLFLQIGIWPVIMMLTMYIQQSMTPKTDPVQAKVMSILPLVFVFIFAKFPAGLVIYWSWSNILSALQQWFITRKMK